MNLMQERGELLRKFISSGENLAACESRIHASKTNSHEGKRRVVLIAVKDMSEPPYRFSQCLAISKPLIG